MIDRRNLLALSGASAAASIKMGACPARIFISASKRETGHAIGLWELGAAARSR